MQNYVFNLDQLIKILSPYSDVLSDEKVKKLEWFLKLEAVKAVDNKNKAEFQEILRNNDLSGLASFIYKYVPDFKEKLIEFTSRN